MPAPAFEPGVPGAVVLVIAAIIAVVIVWLIDWRLRRGRRVHSHTHSMSKDESIGYFRDFSANSSAPGIQEEDLDRPWGEKD